MQLEANLFKQFLGCITLWIQASPSSGPYFKCFVFPYLKAERINNGWLDDLLSWEDAPCHGIHAGLAHVRYPSPFFIHGHISQRWSVLAFINKCIQLFLGAEELYICFLINISTWSTPTWALHQKLRLSASHSQKLFSFFLIFRFVNFPLR